MSKSLEETKLCELRGKSCPRGVKPQNAARFFKNPAPVLFKDHIRELLDLRKGASLLEIGAGCLRNANYLQRSFRVTVLEVPTMEARFPGAYAAFRKAGGRIAKTIPNGKAFDLALATFTIETICPRAEREKTIRSVFHVLRPEGCFILSVRGPKDVVTAHTKGMRCGDGFTTPNKTFIRPYTRRQLETLLRRCGFSNVTFLHKATTSEPELLHAMAWK